MTRQKKEIIKKIDGAMQFIEVDMELGCGFAPADAYRETEEYIYGLQEELAHLSYYETVGTCSMTEEAGAWIRRCRFAEMTYDLN